MCQHRDQTVEYYINKSHNYFVCSYEEMLKYLWVLKYINGILCVIHSKNDFLTLKIIWSNIFVMGENLRLMWRCNIIYPRAKAYLHMTQTTNIMCHAKMNPWEIHNRIFYHQQKTLIPPMTLALDISKSCNGVVIMILAHIVILIFTLMKHLSCR